MKALIKKIFPILFLKRCFLVFNRLKAATIDRLVFGEYYPTKEEIILSEVHNPFLKLDIDLSRFSTDIQTGFSRWLDPQWTQDQFIVRLKSKQIYIEGKTGWGIEGKRNLIYYSLGFSRAPHVHKPSLIEFLFQSRKEIFLDKVISLRDTGEENYFHFYNDVITKIYFLQDQGLLSDEFTLVVARKLWEKNYFQSFITAAGFTHLKWYVQDQEWIEAKEVIFCKPFTHSKKYLSEIVNTLRRIAAPTDPKKIFLTRGRSSLRFLENEHEVFSILAGYGFEMIDSATLTLDDQVRIFQSATDVVALHGAGLTNIVYRKDKSLRILEIFHPNEYLPFHYVMLATLFGFQYSAIQGTQGHQGSSGGFNVDPKKIQQFCTTVYAK